MTDEEPGSERFLVTLTRGRWTAFILNGNCSYFPGKDKPLITAQGGAARLTARGLGTFRFHALEKEMATYSSVLVWRIPGTGDPGGLPSMGSQPHPPPLGPVGPGPQGGPTVTVTWAGPGLGCAPLSVKSWSRPKAGKHTQGAWRCS